MATQTSPTSNATQKLNMDKDQLEVVREVLEEAIAQRGRYYTSHISFSIRFEADDSFASRNTTHFQNILRLLNLPQARELVIGKDDKMPGWTVLSLVQDLSAKVSKVDGRTLVIGHYAGHGTVNQNGKLIFFASPSAPRPFGLERCLGDLYEEDQCTNPDFKKTDVILILDSCYSGEATRGLGRAGRSVEIVASVGADQKALGNNSARVQNRTFTSRLADSIALRVGRGDVSSISFAEIIGDLRSTSQPKRLPEYHLQVGRVGIRVPILGQTRLPIHLRAPSTGQIGRRQTPSGSSIGGESAASIPATPQLNAVFTVHLDDTDAHSGEVKKLAEWIHSLHPVIGLELTGIYESRSTVILIEAPWHIWAPLNGIQGVALVCEIFGRNMLSKLLLGQQQQQLPPTTTVVGKENRPFKELEREKRKE
ncbi:MAG: hypothetical protein M1839_001511 [Geoglossum umbratile]|nr:MAG: hypothetical protein M1839_001511 [Geoglossum umbratile]